MQLDLQKKLMNDSKMAGYLKQNSNWYKQLNRNSDYWTEFTNQMKEKYKERTTDKVESFIENIDLINSVLGVLK